MAPDKYPFAPFADLIKKKFDEMSKGELFIAGDAREVWDIYLAAFPEGTNPVYRTRSEHDCACCKQFVRNIGNVVAIDSKGNRTSVWEVLGAVYPFAEVAATVATHLSAQPITGLYRVSEKKYGAMQTIENLGLGKTQRWNHFYGIIAPAHISNKVATDRGEYATSVMVFERGLKELNADAFDTVTSLIASKALYRGEEFLPAIKAFQQLQKQYQQLVTEPEKNAFVWANADNRAALFRNTMMGSLIVDLSGTPPTKDKPEGNAPIALEVAVSAYEKKAAPENYKRSTALITPRMIQDAMETICSEGLEPDLERRHAKLSDISVNNVLWVDNSVQNKMKGGLEGLLMSAVVTPPAKVDADAVEPIGIDIFMADVLPKVKSMELLVKNAQQNKFMSITAPVNPSGNALFKWGNAFGWSYDGNLADSSLRQQVQAKGGRVDGVLRFSHTWNHEARNASLMDLHVFMPGTSTHRDGCHDEYPSGQRVGWNHRTDHTSGGVQDVDYTEAAPQGYVPVENITFPSMTKLKAGDYTFKIHNWQLRQPTQGGFKAEIEFAGQLFQYDHPAPLKNKEWITLAVATLKNGEFTIQHKHPVGMAAQDKWGIRTETFVKVNTLMKSPNHWDDNQYGPKHWFFILEGCRCDEPTRGIYNEFLHPSLDKHRKVFEVLGDKTKCLPTDEQLSGVGFSSTYGDTVLVKVTGDKFRKTYNITF